MAESKVLQIGAEAIILKSGKEITKKRIKKSYRIPEIDEKIRKLRTRSEGKLLEKASKLIDVPKIKKIDEKNKEIIIDFIDGKRLADFLDNFSIEKQKKICRTIGENVAKLHDSNIIHGDLTTSNMIYVESSGKKLVNKNKNYANDKVSKRISVINNLVVGRWKSDRLIKNIFKIFFIDFGLGFISHKIEDKAVDIHLFKEALEARHFKHWEILFAEFLNGYKKYSESKKVLEQLRKVEQRGRYKERY